jgi:hypothetical protein
MLVHGQTGFPANLPAGAAQAVAIQPVITGPAWSPARHGGVQNGIFTHGADAGPMAVVASMIAKLK